MWHSELEQGLKLAFSFKFCPKHRFPLGPLQSVCCIKCKFQVQVLEVNKPANKPLLENGDNVNIEFESPMEGVHVHAIYFLAENRKAEDVLGCKMVCHDSCKQLTRSPSTEISKK